MEIGEPIKKRRCTNAKTQWVPELTTRMNNKPKWNKGVDKIKRR